MRRAEDVRELVLRVSKHLNRAGKVIGNRRRTVILRDLLDLNVKELEVESLGSESPIVVDESLPVTWGEMAVESVEVKIPPGGAVAKVVVVVRCS